MATQQSADVRRQISEANARFSEAFRRGDAEGAAQVYTEDAVILPPDAQIIRGRQAITQFWRAVMGMGVKGADLTTVDLEVVSDDTAYEIGRALLTIEPEGGERMQQEGKFVVVWKRRENGWKWHVDIWNSSPSGQQ
ncbi:MAG TPA: SgcJ/EcaC family oxidoreductase [Longimicrobiaceae bacterium]|nr:SgcJ/EcaC family oxidoreductase [Longimicrobiaceae bacterium]